MNVFASINILISERFRIQLREKIWKPMTLFLLETSSMMCVATNQMAAGHCKKTILEHVQLLDTIAGLGLLPSIKLVLKIMDLFTLEMVLKMIKFALCYENKILILNL